MDFLKRAYSAAPLWLQNLMISSYGLHLRRMRYGSIQQAMLRQLRESQRFSPEQLQRHQLDCLNEIISTAASEVPFYRDRGLLPQKLSTIDDLAKIPVLTKTEVQQAGKRLVSLRYSSKRLREIHTGGTTGKPLTIYCDSATLQRNYAFFERFREWAGIAPGARVATFAGRAIIPEGAAAPYWRHNFPANTLLFSSYHIGPGTLDAYIQAMAEFAPQLIDTYPSSIEPIARQLIRRPDLRLQPRAIITSSETLLPEVRQVIESAFGCRVFDHYGSAEMVALVTQCEYGSYHVNPEFGILEILRDGIPARPGECGEIVATGFINPVMPLLRYAMGDFAVAGAGSCRCGRAFPTIERIEGRADDVLVTPEGYRVGRLDPIFKAVSSLYEARIVQDLPDHIRVEIVVVGEFAELERRTLMEGLRARLGPSMRIDIEKVPKLDRTRAGKLKTVVNELTTQTAQVRKTTSG